MDPVRINFTAIGSFVDGQAAGLAVALGAAKPLAVALIMYFFLVGVIQGYILTRAVLSGLFSRLDGRPDAAGAE